MCFACAATASVTPAALPETESTYTDEASGFTVLGEVKPRTIKKVHEINYLVLLTITFSHIHSEFFEVAAFAGQCVCLMLKQLLLFDHDYPFSDG